ncbi:MAG: F0F1 ATP synthase subunit B [Parvularculaceae bacterium]
MHALASLAFAAAQNGHGADAAHGYNLLQDLSFWTLFAFLIVMGIFWRAGVHRMIAGALDQRQNRIADELDKARCLREEAQELLAQYQRRQRQAEDEARDIIEQAKRDAQRLSAEAREKINEQMTRRTKAAEEKIARAEAQALADVRGQVADLAVVAAAAVIRERMDSGAQSALVDKAIAEVRSRLN